MKNLKTTLLALTLILAMLLCFAGCNGEETEEAVGLWKDATYTEDATVGEGSKTINCSIEQGGKVITVTVKTDKAKLGDALFECGLINDPSFFDTWNGMKADWEADKAYWAFYIDGVMASVGVDSVEIHGGERYGFVYTK